MRFVSLIRSATAQKKKQAGRPASSSDRLERTRLEARAGIGRRCRKLAVGFRDAPALESHVADELGRRLSGRQPAAEGDGPVPVVGSGESRIQHLVAGLAGFRDAGGQLGPRDADGPLVISPAGFVRSSVGKTGNHDETGHEHNDDGRPYANLLQSIRKARPDSSVRDS